MDENALAENRVCTVSNGLTLFRIVLLPFILFFLLQSAPSANALVLFLLSVAVLTDVLDGYFARRLSQVSNLGKILDPLADKITIGSMAVFLMFLRGLPGWAVVLIVGRDLAILFCSFFLIRRRGIIPMSNLPGKITGVALACLVIVYILGWHPLAETILWITTISLAVSASSYALYFLRRMKRA